MIQQDGESHQAKRTHPQLAGLRALVVDDNDSARNIIIEILEGLQIRAVSAAGPQAARELLSESDPESAPYNLILIDSDMPENSGFELAEWIIKQQICDAGIIMLLTFPHLKRKAELEALGIKASIVKPFGALELENTILSTLGIDKPDLALSVKAQKKAVRTPSRPLNILVAEDTPFNQKFIQRLLERWNHRFTIVGNGRDALEALKKQSFDVVLMDVQMPHLNGLEATTAIRIEEQQSKTHIPVIAMTAHAIKGDRERCLEAGMDEYVSKPIDSDKLFDAIEKLTEDHGNPETADGDTEMLLKAFDGDWDFLKEVVDVFLSDYPKLLEDLRQASKDGDSDTLMRAAHSLKGILKNFQADAAAAVAFELENKAKGENFDGVPEAIESLAGQIAELDKTLRGILKQHDG
jgi:CheY-like chemotaxis protein